jgi:hypothetical protein
MRKHPPLRHFIYVLGTVNIVTFGVLVLVGLAFEDGVNLFAVAFVFLVVNVISAVTVARQL